jgi:hypothetical protein
MPLFHRTRRFARSARPWRHRASRRIRPRRSARQRHGLALADVAIAGLGHAGLNAEGDQPAAAAAAFSTAAWKAAASGPGVVGRHRPPAPGHHPGPWRRAPKVKAGAVLRPQGSSTRTAGVMPTWRSCSRAKAVFAVAHQHRRGQAAAAVGTGSPGARRCPAAGCRARAAGALRNARATAATGGCPSRRQE